MEGQYIYCIIDTRMERNFGPVGIGGADVMTVGYNDLSMVVSVHPLTKFIINPDTLLAHQKVIEKVMEEFDSVLPVRFGTVASNANEIRNLLDRRYMEFKNQLMYMKYKIELEVKGIWKNMNLIFNEILEENREIKMAKEKVNNNSENGSVKEKSEIGKMIKSSLEMKRKTEMEKMMEILKSPALDIKSNKITGDEMFMNTSFLVDKGREKEFDNIMEDLSNDSNDRIKFVYTGPLPVYNFVDVVIYPEEWEK